MSAVSECSTRRRKEVLAGVTEFSLERVVIRKCTREKAKQLRRLRKKDESMKARGIDEATAEHDVLFDYDPETDGLAYGDDYDEYDEVQDAFHDAELIQTREDYGDHD